MHKLLKRRIPTIAVFVIALTLIGGTISLASLNFSGTGITGDTGIAIDGLDAVSIGASSSTGITIGHSGITTTLPGLVTVTGTTTTVQDLVINGTCIGCSGGFTAGQDLSGTATSQTVVGIQGNPVLSTAPSTNQVLTWNGSSWTPENAGCVPTTYTVTYTDSAFHGASTTATETLFSLDSSRQKLCGAVNDPQVAFAGSGISAMTCSLGSPTSGNSAIYLPALNMAQTTESVSQGGVFSGRDLSTPDSNLAVVLTCLATGGNFGTGGATNLTAGKAWITVYTTTLPAGN
jgi:hypothetical protein